MAVKAKLIYEDNGGGPPVFNWKTLESIPGPGKYVVLNLSPVTKSIFVSTAYIPEGVRAETLFDYLKWAIAWCEFPEIYYELIPEPKELA